MLQKKIIKIIALLFVIISPCSIVIAANFQSANFDLRDPALGDFGGDATSTNFEQLNIGGGQMVTGESTSTNFILRSGFFYFDQFTPKSQNWRWYDDETNETPASPLASENVAPASVGARATVKLRMTIKETQDIGGKIKFKLQFSKFSDFSSGITDVVEQGSCVADSRWCYTNGGGIDNGVITTTVLSDADACADGVGDGCGTHNESGTTTPTFTHKKSTTAEYEFTINASGPESDTTYFFRAFDATNNNPVLTNVGYTFPSLSISGATLTFTISGLPIGTATEGVVTDITTTGTAVPFGALESDVPQAGAQRLTVTTNAEEGYQIFVKQTQGLIHTSYGGVEIPGVDGTNVAPSAFGIPGGANGAYGYHAGDDVLAGGSTRFTSNDTYAKLETTAREVSFSSGPVTGEITDMVYKVEATNQQEGGSYNGNLEYIIVPTF